ncbi:MAG: glycoside hydrolase family 25 protein [Bacteroidetes bacterium]|nr:MAG: glycoside hydrolase family 25 protein [Bacteroidota bacterium]
MHCVPHDSILPPLARMVLLVLSSVVLWRCTEETPRMGNYEVEGIDVSHYQSLIDWEAVRDAGFAFAFVKATEGQDHADTLFCRNWDEMKRVGILRGAYHFYRPEVPALVQAENFLLQVELEAGDLPPVLDVEVRGEMPDEIFWHEVFCWLAVVEHRTGKRPILYTYQKFFNEHLHPRFADYPLWIARYNRWLRPSLKGRKQWLFWQYGDKGRVEGIDAWVDFNVFAGNLRQLQELCLGKSPGISQL